MKNSQNASFQTDRNILTRDISQPVQDETSFQINIIEPAQDETSFRGTFVNRWRTKHPSEILVNRRMFIQRAYSFPETLDNRRRKRHPSERHFSTGVEKNPSFQVEINQPAQDNCQPAQDETSFQIDICRPTQDETPFPRY